MANKQPSNFSRTKRPSFWLSKTPSFASIHYDGESGRLDEFVLKFSQNRFALRQRYSKWLRAETKIKTHKNWGLFNPPKSGRNNKGGGSVLRLRKLASENTRILRQKVSKNLRAGFSPILRQRPNKCRDGS